jgi:hypothetical protein
MRKISGNSRAIWGETIASNSTAVHPRDLSVKSFLPTSELENSSTFSKQLVTYLQTTNQLLLKALELLVRWKM